MDYMEESWFGCSLYNSSSTEWVFVFSRISASCFPSDYLTALHLWSSDRLSVCVRMTNPHVLMPCVFLPLEVCVLLCVTDAFLTRSALLPDDKEITQTPLGQLLWERSGQYQVDDKLFVCICAHECVVALLVFVPVWVWFYPRCPHVPACAKMN